jgi:Trk-type K+ transport system membrane component
MNDHSTDKILIVALVLIVLLIGVWTKEPKVIDAFYIALGSAITAFGQRIAPKT